MNSNLQPRESVFEQTTPEKDPPSKAASLLEYLELFAWSIFVIMMLFTFVIRTCRVDGASMENTLYNGETLLLYSAFYTPEQDDIVVFHLSDKKGENTLVKRVIATEEQTVVINFQTKEILIDGEVYEDSHAVFKNRSNLNIDAYTLYSDYSPYYDPKTQIFTATVPKGQIFVMGDNRNNSKDSRDSEIGFVDEDCVLGKVLLRVSPFKIFS